MLDRLGSPLRFPGFSFHTGRATVPPFRYPCGRCASRINEGAACGSACFDSHARRCRMKAIRITTPGASHVMKLEEIPTPKPGKGELLVKLAAAGLNFIDTYQRSGLYKLPTPFTPGNEGAGTVD